MIPEIGHFALILALLVAAVQGVLPLIGAHRNDAAWMAVGRSAAQAQWLLLATAFGCLTYAFVANDFSVLYVAQHSNSQLPTVYRVAAVWGGHEGSLLLWSLMLASWTLAVSLLSRALPEAMVARVLGVLGLVGIGLWVMLAFLSTNAITAKSTGVDSVAIFGALGLYYLWIANGVWKAQASAVRRAIRANLFVLAFSVAHLIWISSLLDKYGALGGAIFAMILRIRAPLLLLHALAAGLAFFARDDAEQS